MKNISRIIRTVVTCTIIMGGCTISRNALSMKQPMTHEELRKRRAQFLNKVNPHTPTKPAPIKPQPKFDDAALAATINKSTQYQEDEDLAKALEISMKELQPQHQQSYNQDEKTKSAKESKDDEALAQAISLSLENTALEAQQQPIPPSQQEAQYVAPLSQNYPITTTTVTQIPVYPQNGAYCGYHALFNAKTIFDWLSNKQHDEQRNATLFNFSQLPVMKTRIKALRKNNTDDNINDAEILFLAKNFLHLNPTTYSIIPNAREQLNQPTIMSNELIKTIDTLRHAPQAQHMFILGTMSHYEKNGHTTGTGGHWIAIVAHKTNNKLTYYTSDSARNQSGTINALLPSLRKLIESVDIGATRLNALDERFLKRAEIIMYDQTIEDTMLRHEQVLMHIEDFIAQARTELSTNKFSGHPVLEPYMKRIRFLLEQIAQSGTPAHAQRASALINSMK